MTTIEVVTSFIGTEANVNDNMKSNKEKEECNVKNLSKNFFSSKAGKVGIWVFFWLFEYIFFSWYIDKIPGHIIIIATFIGYVLIIYAIYYWVTQKCSTECQIYTLIILEFLFNKLNQENVFVSIFKCPFWMIYIVLLAYLFIRIFIIEKIYNLLHDIYWGFIESKRERVRRRVDEIISRQEILTKEKKEKTEYIKNRSLLRRQFWSGLRDGIIDLIFLLQYQWDCLEKIKN